MEIIDGQLPWTTEDESHWNGFLQTETGKRLIPKIAESAPMLFDGADVNKTLVRNGELRGFQLSLRQLLDLSHSPPLALPSSTTQYPELDNDEAWKDGQKLEKEKE